MPKLSATNVMPTNSVASRIAIQVSVMAAFLGSGFWNAGTPLAIASTPVSATEPLAKARRRTRMPTVSIADSRVGVEDRLGRALAQHHDLVQAEHDHQQRRADEQVRRDGEDVPRLAQAAQVADAHHDDEEDAHDDAPRQQLRHGRGDLLDRGRGRHRHGQDVVDEQRRARDERRQPPEVLLRHRVGAAAIGIGVADLAVAGGDDREQDRDRDRDLEAQEQRTRRPPR